MAEISPKKALGQHWLHDSDSLQAMVQAAAIQSDDTVLEIGPGLGTLTELLVQSAARVIAVEFDQVLAHQLSGLVPANNLEIVNQDILSFDFTSLPANYKIVANIPYYLTSHLIRIISETSNPPAKVALLIQKEVAERVAAAPGTMSLLSVTAQIYWRVTIGQIVLAELFTPPPKVNSQIVILTRRHQPLFSELATDDFFRVVKAGFSQRRKTLLNSLSSGLHLDKKVITEACHMAQIDPGRRPQTLALEEWYNLYLVLNIT